MKGFAIAIVLMTPTPSVWTNDLETALEQVRRLVSEHRYDEVLDLMAPFSDIEDPESRYAVTAETGRAHFHLGDYQAADAAFREAVRLRPQRAETALYLMATSYLVDDHELTHRILREVLSSGATDLYLAVTLPGERAFLADPAVRMILDEFQRPLVVDLDQGSVLDVELGQPRQQVEQTLGVAAGDDGTALTARAGPYLTWVFGFGEDALLAQIMLHNEHLYRYTPYRLRIGSKIDWRATPEIATSALGAPASTTRAGEEIVVMTWNRDTMRLTLEFAPPRTPSATGNDPARPVLRVVRLDTGPMSSE
jgi:hypothetical protein